MGATSQWFSRRRGGAQESWKKDDTLRAAKPRSSTQGPQGYQLNPVQPGPRPHQQASRVQGPRTQETDSLDPSTVSMEQQPGGGGGGSTLWLWAWSRSRGSTLPSLPTPTQSKKFQPSQWQPSCWFPTP